MPVNHITVFGAGSWGSALAIQLSRNPNNKVTLWGHDPQAIAKIKASGFNQDFLPDIPFPESIELTSNLESACLSLDFALIVVPSYAFVEFCQKASSFIEKSAPIFWATKGFDLATGELLHLTVEKCFSASAYGIISGPTFALEVAKGLPTAITCAGSDLAITENFAKCLHVDNFRSYISEDVIGVEIGGALKNILAIAVGITDGLNLGANTRAALMTRGLSEIMRFGIQMGGQIDTFMGLAGLGDLVLTCTDDLSRNRRFGLLLGAGHSIEDAETQVGQTVEGVRAAQALEEKMQTMDIELPILSQVCQVILHGKNPTLALKELQERSIRDESINH